MNTPKGASHELLEFIQSVVGSPLKLRSHGPVKRRIYIAEACDYPRAGMTTLITLGNSRLLVSMWRGLDVGFELTMTLAKADSKLVDTLADAALANLAAGAKSERRPCVEFDGIYAPGYPPHLYFTDQITCTPKLSGKKRVGDTWVHFLTAIPIEDSELREYDRSVPKLRAKLRRCKRIADYPRD